MSPGAPPAAPIPAGGAPAAAAAVVFGGPDDLMLLGAHGLEGLNLRVDVARRQLMAAGPVPAAACNSWTQQSGRGVLPSASSRRLIRQHHSAEVSAHRTFLPMARDLDAIRRDLNAHLASPDRRVEALSDLHANIQDCFNESGVQIMSPHYENDPATPKIVPQESRHAFPATRPTAERAE